MSGPGTMRLSVAIVGMVRSCCWANSAGVRSPWALWGRLELQSVRQSFIRMRPPAEGRTARH